MRGLPTGGELHLTDIPHRPDARKCAHRKRISPLFSLQSRHEQIPGGAMLKVGCVQPVKVPGSSKGGVASAGRLFQQQHEWFTTTSMGAVHDWRTQAPGAGNSTLARARYLN